MEKLNVAVIGVGSWGKNHARVFSELAESNLVGVFDPDTIKADNTAKRFNIKSFPSIDELLKSEEIDAVTIASPTSTHAEISLKAIENGKHVLIEKPMTSTIEEAEKIIDAEKSANITVAIGFIERFNPIVNRSRELIENKELGNIVLLSARRLGPYWPDRLKDVDVIRDVSIHDIDIFRHLTNKDPLSLFARGGKLRHAYFDYAEILLDFGNGLTGFIESNYLTPHKLRKLMLTCEHGIVEADYITQEYIIEDQEWMKQPKLSWKEPLKAEMKDFIEACLGKKEPSVTSTDGMKALQIALASIESIKSHKVIEISL
ncbi:MAG: Gfo/Idh/MocA family protein [Candidatus Heimdallarchaeaceae archaeon]|jgi:UDP-N-acetylglucosamine 3-dehydrogenase